MSRHTTILVFTDWYLPGYKAGGPIRSIANMVSRLNLSFSIVTSDRDHDSTSAYPEIVPNKWVHGPQNERVIYLDKKHQSIQSYRELINETDYDWIYLNSLFSPAFTLKPLIALRRSSKLHATVLAPRGMLKSGALSVKSKKKKLFLTSARLMKLYNGITWHATNEEEAEEIRQHMGNEAMVRVAPNLVVMPSSQTTLPSKEEGVLRLVTIARISPEKNILQAIDWVLKSIPSDANFAWDIYGTQENVEYLAQCSAALRDSPLNISLKGHISPNDISKVISKYHFFYLPTLGENYGHAIMEALMHSVPVIISDRTPWKALKAQRAGWELPLNEDQFVSVLEKALSMDDDELKIMSKGARTLGATIANRSNDVRANYELFRPREEKAE